MLYRESLREPDYTDECRYVSDPWLLSCCAVLLAWSSAPCPRIKFATYIAEAVPRADCGPPSAARVPHQAGERRSRFSFVRAGVAR
jgi:hypothetical protein